MLYKVGLIGLLQLILTASDHLSAGNVLALTQPASGPASGPSGPPSGWIRRTCTAFSLLQPSSADHRWFDVNKDNRVMAVNITKIVYNQIIHPPQNVK